jgi:hypothetical protein
MPNNNESHEESRFTGEGENEMRMCADCLGYGRVSGTTCVYCKGVGRVLTFAALQRRQEQAERMKTAAPAMHEALRYVSEVAESISTRDADDSDTANITVTVGWLREVREALALIDGSKAEANQ